MTSPVEAERAGPLGVGAREQHDDRVADGGDQMKDDDDAKGVGRRDANGRHQTAGHYRPQRPAERADAAWRTDRTLPLPLTSPYGVGITMHNGYGNKVNGNVTHGPYRAVLFGGYYLQHVFVTALPVTRVEICVVQTTTTNKQQQTKPKRTRNSVCNNG